MKNYEQIRQEVHKKYKDRINSSEEEIRYLKNKLKELYATNDELVKQNEKLKSEISRRNQRVDKFLETVDMLSVWN